MNNEDQTVCKKFICNIVCRNAKALSYSKGSTIINYGDNLDTIYILKKGTLEATQKNGMHYNFINEAEIFGEIAWFKKCSRTANVRAVTDCEIVIYNNSFFKKDLLLEPYWFQRSIYTIIELIYEISENNKTKINCSIKTDEKKSKIFKLTVTPEDKNNFFGDSDSEAIIFYEKKIGNNQEKSIYFNKPYQESSYETIGAMSKYFFETLLERAFSLCEGVIA